VSTHEIPDSHARFYSGGKIGVLVIHGFGGSPVSVDPWAKAFHGEGFTVSVPRLPGHGSSWVELNKTSYHDWLTEVDVALTKLLEICDRVFVAGFSMGGALALRLAQIRGSEIEGLLLVNPVVHDRRPVMKLVPILQLFTPSLKGGATDVAAPNPPLHSYRRIALKALHSARKLWRITERDLYLVDTPLFIGYSPLDHVVNPENSETIIDNVSSIDIREIVFDRSFHNVSLDYDSDLLNSESISFIKEVLSGEIGSGNGFREDDDELVRAEFDEIVAQLDVKGSDYLDILESSQREESRYERSLYAHPAQPPKLKKRQKNAIAALIGGPLYIAVIKIFGNDPLGLDIWPGLIALSVGAFFLFAELRNEPREGDGSAL
jgi:carboxylesterase